ncbi:MAG: TIM barrel protein [Eubacteriales bacterium]|nr:TIM barrel protein [Eubacteriales bacterium]
MNRFEGYLINTCDECIKYVDTVDKPNVKVMLDTFHMNIEEDSLIDAIIKAGSRLGHFHVGEANRKPPRAGRMPWKEIGDALRSINYDGCVVMEPFVVPGGGVGKDIRIWRELFPDVSEEFLDKDAAESVKYLKEKFQ